MKKRCLLTFPFPIEEAVRMWIILALVGLGVLGLLTYFEEEWGDK